MKRYFEFQDSKSYKFWQIEQDGATFTVTYGKIGTAGQQKLSEFASSDLANKEAAKLIAEKIKKGYVEKAAASAKKVAKRIVVNYEEAENGKTLQGKVAEFVASSQAEETASLVIGAWEEPHDTSPQSALDLLVTHSAALIQLRELFVGDMDSEECEISWIIQGNYTRIFSDLPQLERLHIRGSNGLVLSDSAIRHEGLKALIIECGGLPRHVLQQVAAADLPNLEYLLLYIGVEDYGFDGNMDDLRPFLQAGRFPKLNYLGLVDSAMQDEIALAAADAPVLDQLQTLDLSLGTLTDVGGEALLASAKVRKLSKLDLHHHFMSNDMMKKLKALPLIVDVGLQQESDDDDWRYPAVTE